MSDLNPTAAELAERWGFTLTEELPGGHCSRVHANHDVVLKVPFQGEEAETGWIAAVRLGEAGIGPKVHRFDEETGALLMDRILPGTKLSDVGLAEDECRRIVLGFSFRIRGLDTTGLMPVRRFVNPVLPMAQELLSTTTEEVFLHGDLHHENILLGRDGWLVIDPKGLVGDPAFEPSAFIRNPVPELADVLDLEGFLASRIDAIAQDTDFEARRIWGWSVLALGSGPHDGPWQRVHRALGNLEIH